MTVLFASGVETLAARHSKPAAALLVALLAGSLYADVKMFSRPRENWKAAAAELETAASRGACLVFVPENSELYYTFFSPALSEAKCPPGPPPHPRRIALAVSPAAGPADLAKAVAMGFTPPSGDSTHPPYVREFSTR